MQVVLFEYRFQLTQCLMLIPLVTALNPPKASYVLTYQDREDDVNRSRNEDLISSTLLIFHHTLVSQHHLLTNSGRHASLDHEWLEGCFVRFCKEVDKKDNRASNVFKQSQLRGYIVYVYSIFVDDAFLHEFVLSVLLHNEGSPTNAFNWSRRKLTIRGQLQFKLARKREFSWPYHSFCMKKTFVEFEH
jgi:hypothetical protein